MVRHAVVSGGAACHHGLIQPGQPLAHFEVIDLEWLADVNLDAYDLLVVLRSADGDALRARRYQFARFLDRGGVLIALGEIWADWFPGCHWEARCAADLLEPVIVRHHPIVAEFSARDLHWHPATERRCCHGHLVAPVGAEVLIANASGDALLYVDRVTTNGVIVASSNLDPDTHAFHGNGLARSFFERLFERLLVWARDQAAQTSECRRRRPKTIAGLYSGVHCQQAFYADPEFAEQFSVLPVWELAAADLHGYAALWIPHESNQNVLVQNRGKLARYLAEGGTIVCFDEVNQPWLPTGSWEPRSADLNTIRVRDHPMVAHLTLSQVRWHAYGTYVLYDQATILVDDDQGNVMLFLDEASFRGALLAGTIDLDCHVGVGAETTRRLLNEILAWVQQSQSMSVKRLDRKTRGTTRERYPSDLTDLQWRRLAPHLPPPHPSGRPRSVDTREVVNAILYVLRNEITWRALPHDFPPWKTVHHYFSAWHQDGTWEKVRDVLRGQVRVADRLAATPSAAILDSQSFKAPDEGAARRHRRREAGSP